MSVNRPTNPQQKAQDINQKLQLYGIFTAFSNGKVPSNKQIDVAMNSALNSKALREPSKQLSREGRELIADLRTAVEQAKVLMLTKNEGNLLQDFIWQCQVAGTGNASSPNMPVGKDQAKQHGKQAIDGLRTLGTLIISNGQFRKLLSDMSVLIRDMAGDAAQKAASKVNPSEDELNNIDEPAEDDTWHDTPDLGELKNKAKAHQPFGKDGLKQAAKDARDSGNQSGGSILDKAKTAAKSGAQNIKNQSQSNVPDDSQDAAQQKKDQAKQKAYEARDRTKGYLKDKVPQERRDQTIYRLKKMIVEIQGHPDYQSAIDTLLSLAEQYQGYTKSATKQTVGAAKDAHTDSSLTAAEDDLKILIERFANYTSLDDLLDAINQFYKDADRDPELKGWFKHLDVFVRKCLKQRGYVMEDSATDEWNKISDQGDFLFRDRYKNHTQRLIDETTFLGEQFDADKQNTQFADSLKKLFTDLGNDENGKPTFKPHLVKDLFNVIIPSAFESVQYVPIPRIEYSDPMADAIIENLIIESDNLTPNLIEFGNDNYFKWGRKGVPSRNKNKIMGSVSGIQMDLKDISYYIHKKQGFPSIEDTGLMDIFLGGSGFSFKLAMETADKSDNLHFFKVNSVVVDIKHMNIKLKKSKYKLMFSIVKPLLLKVMTPIITKVIEKVIKDKIHQLDGVIYGIYQEAQRVTNEARKNPNPENIQNIYQTYFNALKTKLEEHQEKAKNASADKAVNIAVTKQDSMFKNINLPGGISTKATEYKELAAKGAKWESPIFSIGSARETTQLPPTKAIKRRPHETAPSEIRGPKNLGQGMDAYSKADESDAFQDGDKYGQTGSYGGEQGNYGNPDQYSSARYEGGQSDGYDQYAQQGYSQDAYTSTNGDAAYASQSQSQSQYPAGYVPASSGYTNEETYRSTSPTYVSGGTGGTTLGMSNPVLSGRV